MMIAGLDATHPGGLDRETKDYESLTEDRHIFRNSKTYHDQGEGLREGEVSPPLNIKKSIIICKTIITNHIRENK